MMIENKKMLKKKKSCQNLLGEALFPPLVKAKNFDVDFWPLLKVEKVLPQANFDKNFFSLTFFIFYHHFESINCYSAGFLSS